MKRMMMGLALLAFAALMAPSVVAGQVRMVGVFQCDEGEAQGELGISGLDCRGDCTLTMNEKGEEQAWSFTVEPRINGISPGGPADGLLRVGDFLVAIDGIPITTRDGGVRFANVKPGQEVDILVRREGKLERVMIQAGSICPPPPPRHLSPAPLLPPREALAAEAVSPPPPRVFTVGRLVPPPPPDTLLPTRLRTLGVAVSPRVRVTSSPSGQATTVVEVATALSTLPRRATTGLLARISPTGRLGIGFSCTECGTQTDEETGANVWFFSGPLEVTTVRVGGPADRAGIQRGDLIKAIDGHAIDTDKGGLAFTRLTPGERVRMKVVKRNGSEVEVGLVPEAVVTVGVGARAPVPVPAEEVAAPPLPPALPTRAAVPAPTAIVTAPKGMPLRYSGVIGGVEVEIRGNPVTVSEMRGARTILINAEGLWIRISIPRERD